MALSPDSFLPASGAHKASRKFAANSLDKVMSARILERASTKVAGAPSNCSLRSFFFLSTAPAIIFLYDKGPENGTGGAPGINPLTTHVFVHESNIPDNSFAKLKPDG